MSSETTSPETHGAAYPGGPKAIGPAPRCQVLVVDDNGAALQAMVRILQKAGYEVAQAADGADALRQVRALRPRLVLLDVVLPDISGSEVLRQIRENPQLAGISVVLISALQIGPEQQACGLDAGADGYIVRPISSRELLARVRTHLRQCELTDQLREKQHLLSESQRLGHIGSWFYDMTGPTLWSEEMYRLYGVSADTFIPTVESLLSLIHPDDRSAMQAWIAACAAGEKPGELDYRINLPDGTIRFLRGCGDVGHDDGNRLTHIAGTAQDISESKLAEQALRRSEAKFRTLYDSTSDAVMLLDEKGFFDCNPATLAMLGCATREFCSKHPADVSPPTQPDGADSLMLANQHIATAMKKGSHKFEWTHRRPDTGAVFPAEVLLSAMELDGKRVLQATVRDITERKRLETQMFQSQRMETVGKLAGGVAHKFNSILTAIIGRSQALRGELPAGSPLIEHTTEIMEAADEAATLTRQLLAYGRKQFLQPVVLDLNRVIANMENLLRQLMGNEVYVHIVPGPGLHGVKADPGQIEQVIVNMVINAREAMPHGGKLTLETSNISLHQESVDCYPDLKPGDYVMIAITDTGTGMRGEVKAHIFEPFFTTKGIGQGVGLGLSACYGTIRQSGGHISVASELGRGTTFKIYLPQAEGQTKILDGQ